MPQPSIAWSQANKIAHALWVGVIAYSVLSIPLTLGKYGHLTEKRVDILGCVMFKDSFKDNHSLAKRQYTVSSFILHGHIMKGLC